MISKTLICLLISNLIIATVSEYQIASEEVREESEELLEDTTQHSEEVEDEYRTTTIIPQDEEVRRAKDITEEDIRRSREDFKSPEDIRRSNNDRRKEFNSNKDESVENVTDETETTMSSNTNNDVDSLSNLTNNIDIGAKTETIPIQATTRAMEDEAVPREQTESPGPRIPKSDNDSDRLFTHNVISPPQSTRSIVRSWLEDTWIRSPIGILVPLRATALSRALAVWTDLNAGTVNLSKVCLMAYDENGVSWRSKHNLHPTSYGNHEKTVAEALSKLLLKYQGVTTESRGDGTMRALIGAAKLVPYDSALFVFTDEEAGDALRLPQALRAVVEKRLKVFTLWLDPNRSIEEEDELQALKNISKHTEGDIISYPLQVIDIENPSNLAEAALEQGDPRDQKQGRQGKQNQEVDVDKFDLLVVRRGAGQAISLGVPVENGVSALRVFIEGAVEHAVLYPPNEAPQIDLYNATSVAAFSPSSRTEGISPRDVYLVFPGNNFDALAVLPASQSGPETQAAFVGMWHLSVRCDTCDYRLYVSARTHLHFDVENDTPNSLKFRVTGPVASVRESQLVDEYGSELAKLPFSFQPMAGDSRNVEIDPIVELVAEVAVPAVKGSKIYTKIVGRDLRGEPFVRLAGPLIQPEVRLSRSASIVFPDSFNDLERVEELNAKIYNSQLGFNDSQPFGRVSQVVNQQGSLLTTIQIGLASRLYGAPGDSIQLYFEVTNYREQTVRFSFGAVGELRFLTGINPAAQNVGPGQTVNVIVSLLIPTSVQAGARDTITFTAYGNEQISMSAYVYVSSPTNTADVQAPEVWHSFQGTCIGRTGNDCAQHTWSVTVTARDPISGLLRLSSSPIGLLYSAEFVSGTRQEVTATYRATCCAPRVLINAVDANGNANSYLIDISNLTKHESTPATGQAAHRNADYLSGEAIAAIVLGVFLAIALIILLIFLIYWCVKKRRESRELPSYNTRS